MKEIIELESWISLHITKTLRKLSDAEYAAVVEECREINKHPHPNLMLTQPYRFEGTTPKYTRDPADAMQVLEYCMKNLDHLTGHTDFQIVVLYDEGSAEPYCVTTDSSNDADDSAHVANCAAAATMELAICRFAKNICQPKDQQ